MKLSRCCIRSRSRWALRAAARPPTTSSARRQTAYATSTRTRNSPEDPSHTKHLQRDDAGGLRGQAPEPRRDEVALVCPHGLLDVLVPRAAAARVFDIERECCVFRFWGEAPYEGAFHHRGLSFALDTAFPKPASRFQQQI
ncbi:hypothetical protein DXG01_008531 [Tephrocybe rancida]|nr:hypothetical protein DXG01_008531 [Tephrocybe rancida]